MNRKKVIKEIISYGLQNKKNRHEIINSATMIITVLNNSKSGGKLSPSELDNIVGSGCCSSGGFDMPE